MPLSPAAFAGQATTPTNPPAPVPGAPAPAGGPMPLSPAAFAAQSGAAPTSTAPLSTVPGAALGGAAVAGASPAPLAGGQLPPSNLALREPALAKVGRKGEERELHRLTPEEKQQRRFRRNLLMLTFGFILLVVSLVVLLQM